MHLKFEVTFMLYPAQDIKGWMCWLPEIGAYSHGETLEQAFWMGRECARITVESCLNGGSWKEDPENDRDVWRTKVIHPLRGSCVDEDEEHGHDYESFKDRWHGSRGTWEETNMSHVAGARIVCIEGSMEVNTGCGIVMVEGPNVNDAYTRNDPYMSVPAKQFKVSVARSKSIVDKTSEVLTWPEHSLIDGAPPLDELREMFAHYGKHPATGDWTIESLDVEEIK